MSPLTHQFNQQATQEVSNIMGPFRDANARFHMTAVRHFTLVSHNTGQNSVSPYYSIMLREVVRQNCLPHTKGAGKCAP